MQLPASVDDHLAGVPGTDYDHRAENFKSMGVKGHEVADHYSASDQRDRSIGLSSGLCSLRMADDDRRDGAIKANQACKAGSQLHWLVGLRHDNLRRQEAR